MNPVRSSDIYKDDGAILRGIRQVEAFQRRIMELQAAITGRASLMQVSLNNVNTSTAQGQSEARKYASAADQLAAEQGELSVKYDEQVGKLKALSAAKRTLDKLNDLEQRKTLQEVGSYDRLSTQYSINKIKLNAMGKAKRYATEEGRALETETRKIYEEMNRLQKATGKYTLQVGNYKLATHGLTSTLSRLVAEKRKVGAAIGRNSAEYRKVQGEIRATKKELMALAAQQNATAAGFKKGFNNLKMMAAGYVGVMGAVRLVGNTMGILVGFEKLMSEVRSVTLATDEEFKALRDDAMRLGGATSQTARQVAGLQVEYGKLGFSTKEILAATEATILLSQATGEDLAASGEIAGATVRAFGFDATETQRIVDVMAESFNKSALDLNRFGEAMKYVAPISKAAGVSLEQTSAMMATLADSGIHGSMAGTGLRLIMGQLTTEGKTLRQALQELADKGLSLAGAEEEVGQRAQTALLILASQLEKVDDLTKSFEGAAGSAKRMSDIQMDNLAGSIILLQSAWEGLVLTMSGANSTLRDVVDRLTGMVMWAKENSRVIGYVIKATGLMVAAYLVFKAVTLSSILLNRMHMTGILRLARAKGVYAAATIVATRATVALNTAMKLSGVGLAIALIAGMMVQFGNMRKSMEAAAETQDEFKHRLDETVASMNSSFEALKRSKPGTEERRGLIQAINKEYGAYLPNMTNEKDTLVEIQKAQDAVNAAMIVSITLKEKQTEIAELVQRKLQAEKDALQLVRKGVEETDGAVKAGGAFGAFQDLINKMKEIRKEAAGKPLLPSDIVSVPRGKDGQEALTLFRKEYAAIREFEGKFNIPVLAAEVDVLELVKFQEEMDATIDSVGQFYDEVMKGFKVPKPKTTGGDAATKAIAEELKARKLAHEIMAEGREKDLEGQEIAYLEMQAKFKEAKADIAGLAGWHETEMQAIRDKYTKLEQKEQIDKLRDEVALMEEGTAQQEKQLEIEYLQKLQTTKDKVAVDAWYQRELEKIRVDGDKRSLDAAMSAFELQQDIDKSNFELSKHTKQEERDFELKQQADYYLELIRLAEVYGRALTDQEIKQAKARLEAAKAGRDQNTKEEKEKGDSLWDMVGFKPEEAKVVNTALSTTMGHIQDLMSTRRQAADQAYQLAQEEAKTAEEALRAQQQARADGEASNVKAAQRQYEQKKQAEERALKQKEKAAKQERQLDTAMQASSLVTAAAGIWSSIGKANPILAIAAIALMFSSFAAAKVQAGKLSRQELRGGGWGVFGGGRHGSGNDTSLGESGGKQVYAEQGEAYIVVRRNKVAQQRGVIEEVSKSLNDGTFTKRFAWPKRAIDGNFAYRLLEPNRDAHSERKAKAGQPFTLNMKLPQIGDIEKISRTREVNRIDRRYATFDQSTRFREMFRDRETVERETAGASMSMRRVEQLLEGILSGVNRPQMYRDADGNDVEQTRYGRKVIRRVS